MRIILLDTRANFRADVRTRLLVDDDRSVELLTDLDSSSGLATAIARFKPELVVVADNVYPEQSNWADYGIPVVGYITRTGNPNIFAVDGIPAYTAPISGAAHLLNELERGIPAAAVQPTPLPPQAQGYQSYQDATQYGSAGASEATPVAPSVPDMYSPMGAYPAPTEPSSASQRRPQISFNPPADDDDKPVDAFGRNSAHRHGQKNNQPNSKQSSRNPGAWLYYHEAEQAQAASPAQVAPVVHQPAAPQPVAPQPPSQPTVQYAPVQQPVPQPAPQPVVQREQVAPQYYGQPVPTQGYGHQAAPQYGQQAAVQGYGQPAPVQPGFYDPSYPGTGSAGLNPMQSPAPIKETLDDNRRIRNDAVTSNAVLNDIAVRNTPTKTVAVYAAKGGVGKTTISSELAVILSMTSRGRGNMRVCLVDYNIDFGDVLTTLNLDNRGSNLSHWAADIRRRVAAGESPDDIQYSRQEIEGRLQRVGNSSLYALVAPIAHEDSMDIRSEEPGIILRNIIQNGCFDFVICDTGNNTRDATVSALDAADTILMVVTQDVSAVNCNKSFLQTMTHVGFDIDKIRLVVNGVMPNKFTQVSVQEVEEMFPYPCIARFKRDPEVTKANNCSEPIVRQPNHEFTKEMRKIVAYLTGQPIEEPAKKGFFSRFKKG